MIEEGMYFTIDGRKAKITRWDKGVYYGWVANPEEYEDRKSKFIPSAWNGQGICLADEANSIVATVLHAKLCKMLSISQKNLRKLQYLEEKGGLEEGLDFLIPLYQDSKTKAYRKNECIKYVEKNKRRLERLVKEVEMEEFEDSFGKKKSPITFNIDDNLCLAFLTGRLNPTKQTDKGDVNV